MAGGQRIRRPGPAAPPGQIAGITAQPASFTRFGEVNTRNLAGSCDPGSIWNREAISVNIWRRKSLWVNGPLVLVVAAAAGGSYYALKPSGSSAAVATTAVAQGTVLATVTASGTVDPSQNLGLNFVTGGKITAIYVKVGQRVHAGEKLAAVDNTSSQEALTQAEASLSAASASLAAAEQGETPAAKNASAASAASQYTQVQSAKLALSQEETLVSTDQASQQQSETTAQDNLDQAEAALSTAQTTLSNDEATLSSDEEA